ncbi:importin-11-like [Pluvialis apricaria]
MDLNSASTIVLQVLTQATSQDTAVLKPAEEQLKQWETQPGFYSVLLNIFTNHTLDLNVRCLAVLYFKNGIDRYWRWVAPQFFDHRLLYKTPGLLMGEVSQSLPLVLVGDYFDFPNVCWEYNTAEREQSRRFLECVKDNFLTQLVKEPAREGAFLDLLLVNREGLVGDEMVGGRPGHSDHEIIEFSILGEPCTEVLFIEIFHEYNQTLTPVLLEMVHSLQGSTNMEDTTTILIKYAVYNAVGLAAYELFESVDFDQWFKNQLLAELQVSHNRYKPIRRRVIWLIGQWISVKFKSDLRPMLYEAICNLLQDQDLVVRIETATTLKLNIHDFEFRTDQFLPYLQSMFTLLFQLLQEVTECDTKMHVLHVLSCVIERVNMQIQPYVGCLVQYLPLLWKQSEEHNMLRCAILTTLIHLVQGLGEDSKNLYPFLLPVIQLSTDVSQPPHVYLLEDGLELWLVTLENSPCLTPELLRIFQNMFALLELSSENLKNCFKIINAYIFLSSSEFLQMYAADLCQSFCELLKDITTEGQVQVLKVVENVLKVNPVLGPQMFQPLLPSVFRGIIDGERYPVMMSTYLGVMGRVLLQNANFFSLVLSQMACELGQELDQILGNMIEMWVDWMDNITQPERRKLSALALLSLLPSLNSVIQEKFCAIINISVEGLHDVMSEDTETGTYKDCMLMSYFEEPKVTEDEEPPTEQDKRKKMLALKDPVHTVSLQQFIYEKLKAQQELLGEQGFHALMETVDTEIVAQLQEFLQGF